jgi:hypothetical protein
LILIPVSWSVEAEASAATAAFLENQGFTKFPLWWQHELVAGGNRCAIRNARLHFPTRRRHSWQTGIAIINTGDQAISAPKALNDEGRS